MCIQMVSGYLCNEERILRRYGLPIGLVMMILFSLILFIEALRYKMSAIHWLFAFGWLAFVIYLIVLNRRICVADKIEFSLKQGTILNKWPRNNKIELSLDENYFCTVLACEFGYGKATSKKSFYLFSNLPITQNTIKGQGLFVLENLNKSNIIIIPQNNETASWLKAALKIDDFPIFPTVLKIEGQGDGSLS